MDRLKFDFDVQNIVDGQGVSIAITGMVIVFFALTLISLFIAALPSILKRIAKRWPEPVGHHHGPSPHQPVEEGVSEELVAGIGAALHRQLGRV